MSDFNSIYFYSFSAVRGIQAGRPFYIVTCPLRIIPKIFSSNDMDVPPELKSQRSINKSRIPDMAKYLLDNSKDYIFSAITASIAIDIEFEEYTHSSNLGVLKIPMDAKILINDGQHRCKAIERVIAEKPDLGQDNIPVLFFVDEGLKRSQQMFADLNKYAVKPSPSISTLYDHRDKSSELARYLATSVEPFKGLTEMEKSNISAKSNKLFTLNSIKQATRALLAKKIKDEYSDIEKALAIEYWQTVFFNMPDWKMAIQKEVSTLLLRQEYIHAHGVWLCAVGMLGNSLVTEKPETWKTELMKLKSIDWHKSNPEWIRRTMSHGKINKSMIAIQLTCNSLKTIFQLPLTAEEQLLEEKLISMS